MRPTGTGEGEHTHRGIIPGQLVHVTGEAVRLVVPTSEPSPPPAASGEPHIELIREDDVVQAIEVSCTCGRKIRLRCVY
jgi:hypothetical protein